MGRTIRWCWAALLLGSLIVAAGRRTMAQTPATPASGAMPAMTTGGFRLPAGSGVVITVDVFAGTPGGTEDRIEIDASGRATITSRTYPFGSATPIAGAAQTIDLGVAGLQALLAKIAATGFFSLPQPRSLGAFAGGTRDLTVTLADGTWQANANQLQATGIDAAPVEAAIAAVQAALQAAEGTPVAAPVATPA